MRSYVVRISIYIFDAKSGFPAKRRKESVINRKTGKGMPDAGFVALFDG